MNGVINLLSLALNFYKAPSVETGLELFVGVIEEVLPFLPHEQLRAALDDSARKRADAAADVAEALKFGGT